jgi:hypothetical protein
MPDAPSNWRWIALVDAACERLRRAHGCGHAEMLDGDALQVRLRGVSYDLAGEYHKWAPGARSVLWHLARRNRGEDWANSPEGQATIERSLEEGTYMAPDEAWFVGVLRRHGLSDVAIKLLFAIDPTSVRKPEDDDEPDDDEPDDEPEEEGEPEPPRWPWEWVVERAQARLLRVPLHAARPSGGRLRERLLSLRFWLITEYGNWIEGERQRRIRPWRQPDRLDRAWFVALAREKGLNNAAIKVLFSIDPETAEPLRPEGQIEAPEPLDEEDWEAIDGVDGLPGADCNDGDGSDPVGPAERIPEGLTLDQRVDRLVARILEPLTLDGDDEGYEGELDLEPVDDLDARVERIVAGIVEAIATGEDEDAA